MSGASALCGASALRGARRCARRGVTLVELLVAVAIMAILATAISYAFTAGLDMQRVSARRRAETNRLEAMEQRLMQRLQGAMLSSDTLDQTTFFIGESTGNDTELGCDRLTFTTVAPGAPMPAQLSQDTFEDLHHIYGPMGGVAEISYSTTAVGNAGNRTGLFEREQRPSDGDYTQGGTEAVLEPQVDRIGFQFWNGLQWVDTWDTTSGDRRLPSAVRVNYTLTGGNARDVRSFIAAIPTSDVDANNPVANASTQ